MSERLADGTIRISYTRKYHKGKGRRLNLTDKQIDAIIENILLYENRLSRRELYKATGVKPYTSRAIENGNLKNTYDRMRIDIRAAKYRYKFNWK